MWETARGNNIQDDCIHGGTEENLSEHSYCQLTSRVWNPVVVISGHCMVNGQPCGISLSTHSISLFPSLLNFFLMVVSPSLSITVHKL